MKNRMLKGITRVADLQRLRNLQELTVKFTTIIKKLMVEDYTIDTKNFPQNERKLFRQMDSKRFWKQLKGKNSSTTRKKILKFKGLVDKHGERKIYSILNQTITGKIKLIYNISIP